MAVGDGPHFCGGQGEEAHVNGGSDQGESAFPN
jgi:hypothetical protein